MSTSMAWRMQCTQRVRCREYVIRQIIQDVFDYAALNLEAIALGHPFVEGNKRTAFVMTGLILSENGYVLPDDEETFEFVRRVAMGVWRKSIRSL